MSLLDRLAFWRKPSAAAASEPEPDPLALIEAWIRDEQRLANEALREQEVAAGNENRRGKIRAQREGVDAFASRCLEKIARIKDAVK